MASHNIEPIRIVLPTIFEGMTVNSWLFLEPEPTLIDCGEKTEKAWYALVSALKNHGVEIGDIKRIIITHGHLDHMGMANKIVEHSDAIVWVNEYLYDWAVDLKKMLDRRSVAIMTFMKPRLPEKMYDVYFGFGYKSLAPMWDEIPAERIEVFPIEGSLNFGGSDWDIIYTPGHCINQTCFYNHHNGYFFSADMLLRMIPIPIIDAGLKQPFRRTKSLVMQMASYQKIAQLEIRKTFPGHFETFDNAHELIINQVQKIHQRKEKCFDLIQGGTHEVLDLAKAIYPDRINQATLFMIIGFLDMLSGEGRL